MPDAAVPAAPPATPSARRVAVVGAGMAGLTCAKVLHDGGANVTVFEKADGVGGRVRTDGLGGFKLDRGFQVFLEAYPEAKKHLDYGALDLHPFEPGALVYRDGAFRRLSDPLRALTRPDKLFRTAVAKVGTPLDKLKVAQLRASAAGGTVEHLFRLPERTTLAALRDSAGFSDGMIDAFFRPFLGGVFLERELTTSNRFLYFVFRMFGAGPVSLPSGGIGAIPKQLADRLPYGSVRLGSEVTAATKGSVTVSGKEPQPFDAVVVACGADAAKGFGVADSHPAPAKWHGTTSLYYSAAAAPVREPILMLNGDGPAAGPVNSVCVPSRVSPSYASGGRELISVSVLGDGGDPGTLEKRVRAQLTDWYGVPATRWEHLKTTHIEKALPAYEPPTTPPQDVPVSLPDGRFVCGDWRADPSLNGAMASGRRAAEAVLGG